MKALMAVLILALAVPAAAQEKSKKDDKKQAPAPAASSPDQLMREAEQKAAAGDKDGAAELLRRAVAMPAATGGDGQGDEAVALAQKVAATGGAAAPSALGYAQEAKGDLAASEASYRAALDDPEQKAIASVGLARVLRKTGRAGEAEPILKKAIEDAPGAVEAYKESARVKIALGRASEAVGDAATAAALAEGDAEAQRLVQEVGVAQALAYLATNQPDLAIQDLTKLRDQHDSAEVRVGLARAYIAKRQGDLAATELQKAVELEPNNAAAQYQLGYVQHMLKRDAAAAVGPYDKAVASDPSNLDYRTALAAALVDAKQFDRAATEAGKGTQATPKRSEEHTSELQSKHELVCRLLP